MLFGSGLRVQAWDHDTWWLSFLYLLLCCAEFLTFGRSATMAQAYISSISSSAALVRILTPVPCGTSCVRRLLGKSIASQELQVIRGWVLFMACESFLHGASEAICVLFWVSPPIEVLVATPTCSLGVSVPALHGLRDRETLKPLLRGQKSWEMRASQSLVCRQQQEPLASPNLEKFERVRTSAVF